MAEPENRISCPNCQTVVPLDRRMVCPGCGEDLSSLGRLTELPLAYYNEGLRLAKAGRTAEAAEKLQTAVALRKNFPLAWLVLGKLYAREGRYQEARACWEQVLTLEPGQPDATACLEKIQPYLAPPAGPGLASTPPREPASVPVFPFAGGRWPGMVSGLTLLLLVALSIWLWQERRHLDLRLAGLEAGQHSFRQALQGLAQELKTAPENRAPAPLETAGSRAPGPTAAASPEPAPSSPGAAAAVQEYTIKKGDTLQLLAARFYGSPEKWPLLYEINKETIGRNPDCLLQGTRIRIPPPFSEPSVIRR